VGPLERHLGHPEPRLREAARRALAAARRSSPDAPGR
jgi:hypothetical protein